MLAVKENQGNLNTKTANTSLESIVDKILKVKRSHWGIEYRLHWVIDIAFDENRSHAGKNNAPHNIAVLQHMAVNLLKQGRSAKAGIKAKHLKCVYPISIAGTGKYATLYLTEGRYENYCLYLCCNSDFLWGVVHLGIGQRSRGRWRLDLKSARFPS